MKIFLLVFFSFSFAIAIANGKPILVFGSLSSLDKTKALIESKDPDALAELKKITRSADQALEGPDETVIAKTQTPPSGDKHDYFSLSPYWWPDPKKSDGLPHIRKDGKVNPKSRGEHTDYDRKERLFRRLRSLAPAAYLTGDSKYSRKALSLLKTWFIDPRTKMNPHLNYAQGIPGREEGRCFGIIEWCDIADLITPIQLLRASGNLPPETDKALVVWINDYSHWLQTSKLGIKESQCKNNHATWYDVQLVALLLFLDKKEPARKILEEVTTKRIATQIEPDGKQPHELARTRSLSYSKMNLSGFRKLIELGKKVDVDLESFETEDGRSITKAAAFLKPYLSGKKKWPYQQIKRK